MYSEISLTSLYLKHICDIQFYLYRKVRCRETAAELAHETFIRIIDYKSNKPIQNAQALIYSIANNLAIDHHRASSVRPAFKDPSLLDVEQACDLNEPVRVLTARQTLDKLRIAIEKLPPRCHRAFVMHKFEGKSHLEIAVQFGVSRNAVEKLLIRALVHLRQELN